MLDFGLYKAQLDLAAELPDLNKRLRDHSSGPKWEERDRAKYEKSGWNHERIETAILDSMKRREQMLQDEKANPQVAFVPSGEDFHFESVDNAITLFAEDLIDIDFHVTLPVDFDQVDLTSSVNIPDQWNIETKLRQRCALRRDLRR